jgi:hypothetical protein
MRKMKASAGQPTNEQQKYQYDPQAFLLTPNQMLDNDYPMPSYMPGSKNATKNAEDANGKTKEIGQVRAGNSSVGDEVWLPGSRTQGVVAEVVHAGGAILEKGLSLSDEILGRLVGSTTNGKPSSTDEDKGSSASSSSSSTKKAKLASKKREKEGDAEVVVEVSTKTAADLERFSVGKGWMETPTLAPGESSAGLKFKVLAIDCEMVSSLPVSLIRLLMRGN